MAAPSNLEFTVKVSYMEIYMEKVRDLLNRKLFTLY
jgi:kinesin family protein 5